MSNKMNTRNTYCANITQVIFASFLVLICLTLPTYAQETYRFERMWPTLQQPWYFYGPRDVVVDSDGFIYLADAHFYRIQKLTADGHFVTKWGSDVIGRPRSMALDDSGFLYVVDDFTPFVNKFRR